MVGSPNPLDLLGPLNPFGWLADGASKVVADGWTAIMLGFWAAGLSVLQYVLTLMDAFLTPDLSADGPGSAVYRIAFWGAGTLVIIMGLCQLGIAAFRRDGKSLARVLIGAGQFAVIWGAWISYGIAVIAACSALTRALMKTLLKVDAWAAWRPWETFDITKDTVDATVATVLGLLGLFLWIAAIGHFLVMLTRAAALLVLAATTPISAAGLVSDAGRPWFWKSLRWFHAAALTPVLMVLMIGLGVQLTTGVAQGKATGAQAALGTALPGTMLILVSTVAPVALFRLLAFVDPGTSSGAAMRQGMASAGGLQGLLSGSASTGGANSAASSSDDSGRSQGEAQSAEATSGRFASAMSGLGGTVGGFAAAGIGAVTKAGAIGASVGTDVMNQTAVGDSSYYPDYQRTSAQHDPARFNPDARDPGDNENNDRGGNDGPDGGAGDQQGLPSVPLPPTPTPPPASLGKPAGPPGGGTAGGGGGGAAATAAEIPPVA